MDNDGENPSSNYKTVARPRSLTGVTRGPCHRFTNADKLLTTTVDFPLVIGRVRRYDDGDITTKRAIFWNHGP